MKKVIAIVIALAMILGFVAYTKKEATPVEITEVTSVRVVDGKNAIFAYEVASGEEYFSTKVLATGDVVRIKGDKISRASSSEKSAYLSEKKEAEKEAAKAAYEEAVRATKEALEFFKTEENFSNRSKVYNEVLETISSIKEDMADNTYFNDKYALSVDTLEFDVVYFVLK